MLMMTCLRCKLCYQFCEHLLCMLCCSNVFSMILNVRMKISDDLWNIELNWNALFKRCHRLRICVLKSSFV